ncbi:RidA family protein [Caballeronia ptereochthonis]|uniref:Endoribonuclease L-PSP n=1 Tax=Caballeronia ptereochthonis TaxID=1777144 RepID=A0A158DZF3_9BURK|nr:RidA family protein [Caballeronia ptereochthonis]SAL00021.1 endoribonuclease L-PSP [Caballeronia ptereochthonis]
MPTSISSRVIALGAHLPVASRPVANYLAHVRVGDLLFISGQVPLKEGRPAFVGTIGDALTVEDGMQAAELAALGVLAQLADATGDKLERIERVTRVGVFISCVAGFERQSVVADHASNLFVNVLGDKGRHARTAVGVASLPSGVAVEVDAIVQLRG